MRRVGWMDLVPAEGSVLPAGMFPARLEYPADEPLVNPNFPGVESITTKVMVGELAERT